MLRPQPCLCWIHWWARYRPTPDSPRSWYGSGYQDAGVWLNGIEAVFKHQVTSEVHAATVNVSIRHNRGACDNPGSRSRKNRCLQSAITGGAGMNFAEDEPCKTPGWLPLSRCRKTLTRHFPLSSSTAKICSTPFHHQDLWHATWTTNQWSSTGLGPAMHPVSVIHKFTEEMASSNFLHDIAFPVWRWWVEDASGVKGE